MKKILIFFVCLAFLLGCRMSNGYDELSGVMQVPNHVETVNPDSRATQIENHEALYSESLLRPGLLNLAPGNAVYTSSATNWPGYVNDSVIDERMWTSEPNSESRDYQYLQVWLGSEKSFSGIAIDWNEENFAKFYGIYIWDDGWKEIYNKSGKTAGGTDVWYDSHNEYKAEWVLIWMVDKAGDRYGIHEFELLTRPENLFTIETNYIGMYHNGNFNTQHNLQATSRPDLVESAKWYFEKSENPETYEVRYHIRNAATNGYLMDDGMCIRATDTNVSNATLWNVHLAEDNRYRLRNQGTGRYVGYDSEFLGTNLQNAASFHSYLGDITPHLVKSSPNLISYSLLETIPKNVFIAKFKEYLIENNADPVFIQFLSFLIKYDVEIYRIVYNTMVKGVSVEASGVCLVPQTETAMKMMSYQHGTILKKSKAPSEHINIDSAEDEMLAALSIAASGWICSMPDYLGYGESRQSIHPYLNAELTASASADMLKAVRSFTDIKNRAVLNQYNLMGYSEGGYATLALLREIQQNHSKAFNVTGSSAGAGPYNVAAIADTVTAQQNMKSPAFASFLFYSYNDHAGWNRDLADFFTSPYNHDLPGLLNGVLSGTEVDARLPSEVNRLFSTAFLTNYKNGQESEVIDSFYQNSLDSGWAPESPVYLFHGTSDQIVPFSVSENAYNEFSASGGNVTLLPLDGKGHMDGIFDWFMGTMEKFYF